MDFALFCGRFQGDIACFDGIRFELVGPTIGAHRIHFQRRSSKRARSF